MIAAAHSLATTGPMFAGWLALSLAAIDQLRRSARRRGQ